MARRERRAAAKGWRRGLKALGAAAGVAITFAGFAVTGIVLHLGTPPARRLVAQAVNALLTDTFKGSLVIEQVGRLSLAGADGVRVTLRDSRGAPILHADGACAEISLPSLLRSMLLDKGNIVVKITHARISNADVSLEQVEDGALLLERAFEPKIQSAKPPDPNARGVEVSLPDIGIDHVWVHGRMNALALPIDVDLHRIEASLHADPETLTVDVNHVELLARGLPYRLDPHGTLTGRLRTPSRVAGESIDASLSFDGSVAEQRTTLSGSMDGKVVEAHFDVPHVDPTTLREAITQVPLNEPGSIHVDAEGTLPRVSAKAHVAVGPAVLDVDAKADFLDAITAEATVIARGVDVHSFVPQTHSGLAATVTASVTTAGALVHGQFTVENPVGRFQGQVIPKAHVTGRFTEDSVAGVAKIEETGAPTEVDFNLHPIHGPGSAQVLDFDTRADVPELERVPRLAHLARGQARLHARGRLVLPQWSVAAEVQAAVTAASVSKGEICFDTGTLEASVHGRLTAPSIDARFQGAGLTLGDYVFRTYDVKAKGGTASSHFVATLIGENTADVHLEAQVHAGHETTIDDLAVGLHRKDADVMARVGRVRIAGGMTSIERIRIDGMGKFPIEGSVKIGRDELAVKATGEDLNLRTLGRLLGIEDQLEEGHVAFDVDVASTRRNGTGRMTLDLFGGKFPHANGASGRFQANFDGRHLSTELRGAIGELGWVTVVADDVHLGGGLLDAASWRSATGHLAVDANVDLRRVASAFPRDSLPFDQTDGRVHLQAKIGRESGGETPDVDASVSTQGLVVVAKHPEVMNPDGTEVQTEPPFQTHAVDFELSTHVKGKTNETTLAARLFDGKEALIQLNAEGSPPYAHLLAHAAEARTEIENLPLKVDLIVPKRSFKDFPEFAKVDSLRGAVEVAVHVEGTALAPRVDAKARAYALQSAGTSNGKPVNVDLQATYDAKKAVLTVKAARPEGFVAEADAEANVSFVDLVRGAGQAPPLAWDAHATGRFHAFPIDTVPFLAHKRIRGDLTGTVTLDGLHQDPKVDVNLDLKNLRVGRADYKGAKITAHVEDGQAIAAMRLDQLDGFAETHASAGFAWGKEVAPSLDQDKPIEVSLKAQAFRAAIARPFLAGIVNQVDGRIDADTKLTYDLRKKNGKVVGDVRVRDATFEIPFAGGEFHAVRARLSMDPFGTVHVDDVSANGATGRLSASATVMLDGLRLRSADAKVHVDKDQKIPIEVEGVPMGDAWGDVALKAQAAADGNTIVLNVDLPTLHVDLPQSTGHSVEPLGPNPDVRAGIHESDGDFAIVNLVKPEKPRPPDSSHVHVAIRFGNDVWVKRDTTLKLQLHGGPAIDVTDKARVSGQIVASAGTIEVQSKKFEVEHATVSFVGDDPGNPQIVATAHWDAPSKTRVFVDVTGTPKDLKLAFRSEPDQLSQDAILSLILFGDENGAPGASQSSASADDEDINKAAGVGGGVVTQGLNKAIAGVTDVDITTRVDTSESRNPRPELAVQVTRNVSAAIAYNLGIPPPGQNPDRTQLIVDYRFVRNWSLLTTLGDSGSSIFDLLWQYRY